MFYIIETKEQLERLKQKNINKGFIQVIPLNDNIHPKLNKISLIYLKDIINDKGYILCLEHNESLSLEYNDVFNYLCSIEELYTLNKKEILYYIPLKKIFDLNFKKLLKNEDLIDLNNFNTSSHNFLNQRNSHFKNINFIIPISKHFEKFENLFGEAKKILEIIPNNNSCYNFLNNDYIYSLFNIENQGIKVNKDEFNKFYKKSNEYIYCKYNIYTTTYRPSNHDDNINFSALNKEDGSRKCFIPKNDWFIEYDFKAYHIHLLCKLIDFEFEDDIYIELGKYYLENKIVDKDDYNEFKKKTFQILYTNEIKKHNHIFFRKINELKLKLIEDYKINNYILSPIYKIPLYNITSNTQFLPYLLQCYETEVNIEKIKKINELLIDTTSKLILYTYDSFLIDFSIKDNTLILEQIENILKEGNFKVSIKKGKDLHNLKYL